MDLLAIELKTWVIIAVAAVAAVCFFYGALRRFSRMSWWGIETLAAFGIALPFTLIPYPSPLVGFLAVVGALLAGSAGVLAVSGTVRSAFRRSTKKRTWVTKTANVLGGGLLAVGEGVLFLLVLCGIALVFTEAFTEAPPALLQEGLSSPVYKAIGKYALDVALVFLLVLGLKGGFKLGFGRYLWAGLTLFASFLAVFGSLLLVLNVPFLSSFAGKIAGLASGVPPFFAQVAGVCAASFLVFLVFFVLIIIVTVLVSKVFAKVNRSRTVNILSGTLQAAIVFFVLVALFMGIGVGLNALLGAASSQEALAPAVPYIERFLAAVCRSPIIAFFHYSNPLVPLLP